jgi:hypothetical protein
MRGNRVLYVNGRPIASRESRDVRWLVEINDEMRTRAIRVLTAPGALAREPSPSPRQQVLPFRVAT